jgi:hypothetical protein
MVDSLLLDINDVLLKSSQPTSQIKQIGLLIILMCCYKEHGIYLAPESTGLEIHPPAIRA